MDEESGEIRENNQLLSPYQVGRFRATVCSSHKKLPTSCNLTMIFFKCFYTRVSRTGSDLNVDVVGSRRDTTRKSHDLSPFSSDLVTFVHFFASRLA